MNKLSANSPTILNYEKSRQRSFHIHQFKCFCRGFPWWGPKAYDKCRCCDARVEMLPTREKIGLGWFECACENRYPDLAADGNKAKCPKCGNYNHARFVVPENSQERSILMDSHLCDLCNDSGCKAVEKVLNLFNSRGVKHFNCSRYRPSNRCTYYEGFYKGYGSDYSDY
jgi:hypothetical protein